MFSAAGDARRPATARPRLPRPGAADVRAAVCGVLAIVVLAALVYIAVRWTRSAGLVAALWPACGLAFALWYAAPQKRGLDPLIAAALACAYAAGNLLAGNTLAQTGVFVAGNMTEVTFAVWAARTLAPEGLRVGTLNGFCKLVLTAAVAPIPSATLVSALFSLSGPADLAAMFGTWWFGHALGFITVGALALSLNSDFIDDLAEPVRQLELAGLLALLAALGGWVFLAGPATSPFLVTPMLLLAVWRFRMPGAAISTLVFAFLAILGVVYETGPLQHLPGLDRADKVKLVQMILLVGCVPMFAVATLLDDRDRLREAAGRA